MQTIIFIIFRDFLMFYQIFFSLQLKQCVIITYKYDIYELPHELQNDIRLKDLRKLGNIREMSKLHRMITQCPKKTLEKQKLNFSRCVLFNMKTRVSLKYFVRYCLWKHFFNSNSPQTSSNLICLTFLVTLRPLALF